jgi:hypothetical protein
MRSGLVDDAARAFAIGFYGGLGDRASVTVPTGRAAQLAVLGVEPRADHQLEQLLDRKLMQAREHPSTPTRLLVEPRGFGVEHGVVSRWRS